MTQAATAATAALLDGRYQLLECIGAGAMADVYRAEDITLERTVAVKLMRGADGLQSSRVRSEMAVLASLSHPSLVTLFDARLATEGPSYLVMELVDGPTLGARLRDGPLTPREAAQLAAELADALHVVHDAGIVHRDVKPSNVLLSPCTTPGRAWRAKLADFGIAFLADAARQTSPGLVVGTLAYLAPEQLHGATPSPAADVYSLGIVLLEALTGEPVFRAGTPAEMLVLRHAEPVRIPRGLPRAWANLLRRMTADDPTRRPTALQVAVEAASLASLRATPARTRTSAWSGMLASLTHTLPLPASAPTEATAVAMADSAPTRDAGPRRATRVRAGVLALATIAATAMGYGLWSVEFAGAPSTIPLFTDQPAQPKLRVDAPAPTAEPVEPAPAGDVGEPATPDDREQGPGGHGSAEGPQGTDEKAAKEQAKQAAVARGRAARGPLERGAIAPRIVHSHLRRRARRDPRVQQERQHRRAEQQRGRSKAGSSR